MVVSGWGKWERGKARWRYLLEEVDELGDGLVGAVLHFVPGKGLEVLV